MFKCLARAILPALLATAGLAHADEAAVKSGIETFLGAPVVDSVAKVPYGDLYEVVLKSGELIYTDERASFILDGQIIDARTRRNITEVRRGELSKIDFASLPLKNAVLIKQGSGARKLVVFGDPNCSYCKRLAKELTNVKDVTVYTFMVPILGPDSGEKAHRIWCAKDRAASWNNWMVDGKAPAAAECDTSAIQRNAEFAQRARINGTPTIFFADGNRVGGYMPAAEIEKALLHDV